MADIIYDKTNGKVKAIFKTHGVSQNVRGNNVHIAIKALPVENHLDLIRNYYIEDEKLVEKKTSLEGLFEIDIVYTELKEPYDPIMEIVMTGLREEFDIHPDQSLPEQQKVKLPVVNGEIDISGLPKDCEYSIFHPHYRGESRLKGAEWRQKHIK